MTPTLEAVVAALETLSERVESLTEGKDLNAQGLSDLKAGVDAMRHTVDDPANPKNLRDETVRSHTRHDGHDDRFRTMSTSANRFSGPGFNVSLPDPETVGKYGVALKTWGLRALVVAAALVLLLKVNACDGDRMLDRIERRLTADSTARARTVERAQTEADADRERNTERILEALPGDGDAPGPAHSTPQP